MKAHAWKEWFVALGIAWLAPVGLARAAETKLLPPRGEPIERATNQLVAPAAQAVLEVASNSVPVLLTPAQILADRTNMPTLLNFSTLGDFDCQFYSELEPPRKHPTLKLRHPIPEKIKAFNGRRVTLTGFLIPIQGDGRYFHEFLLVRDLASCCFGRAPKMNHWVRVRMKSREAAVRQTEGRPVSVTGMLIVGEFHEYGVLSAIYQLEGEKQETTVWLEEPPEIENRPLGTRRR